MASPLSRTDRSLLKDQDPNVFGGTGTKNWWKECQPEFWLPVHMDCTGYPRFQDFNFDAPSWNQIIHLGELTEIPKWAWGKWLTAFKKDELPSIPLKYREQIAKRLYQSARYKFITPIWRQYMHTAIGTLDDIEDQISTLVWIAEGIGRKVVPVPRGILNSAKQTSRQIDKATRALSTGNLGKNTKVAYANRQKEIKAARKKAHGTTSKLIFWIKDNWGKMLEAAQATDTWFDVGIVLGPIAGFIEDGLWTLGTTTVDNYLVALDALMPGYRDSFHTVANEYKDMIVDALEEIERRIKETEEAEVTTLIDDDDQL